MDINVARTFLEIVKTGSFVGAASNLNLTQTAVSARIRTLEEQLERPVFVRNKAGAKLTPAGERFFKFATSLVQVWERARQSVALPSGKDTTALVGAELSLWSPLLRHWLLWMRKEHPQIAVSAVIDSSDHLMEQVQDGSLDVAVLYGAPRRPGIIAELLFEEKLVLVRTTPDDVPLRPDDYVQIDWGQEFTADYRAAFPDHETSSVNISHGPLALEYILAVGGCGYFREGVIRSYVNEGRLAIVRNSPQFSYSAYVVHSTKADHGVIDLMRDGFKTAARQI